MQINYNNNGVFEKLYPVTLGGNVRLNYGKTLEEWKMEVDNDFNILEEKNSENTSLWSGNSTLSSTDIITPTKKITDCKNGWLLMFKYAGAYNNLNYEYIPKHHIAVGNSGGIKIKLASVSGTYVQKYIYVKSDTITGHSSNVASGNEVMELFNIYEF